MDASISVVVVGQDSLVVDVEGFFFVARHEVDVELGYADLAEAVELLAMLLDGAYHAEAVDYFVGDEGGSRICHGPLRKRSTPGAIPRACIWR